MLEKLKQELQERCTIARIIDKPYCLLYCRNLTAEDKKALREYAVFHLNAVLDIQDNGEITLYLATI